jgi:FkbM family methyltransferase
MVDLRGAFSISDIAIYNRVDSCPERSRTLRASISLDGVRWHLVYDHSNREPFGGMGSSKPPLLIMLADACARYVKLECVGQTCFHLDEVEIFGTPVPSPDDFLKKVTGVIHIGANSGQERERYERYGLSVIWVEPIPEIFEKLQANIREYPRQRAYNCLVTDRVNHSYEFNISNNAGESSSILDLALHKDVWPGVEYTRTITLVSTTLEALVGKQGINISGYQALVLDTQGSELLVLKGAGELLRSFSYVKAEAPDFESYLGCCQIGDLSDYLGGFGFRELQRTKFSEHPTAGCYYDVVYERSPN